MSMLRGAKDYLDDAAVLVTYEAIADDQEEEMESMTAAVDIDDKQQQSHGTYLRQPAESSKRRRLDCLDTADTADSNVMSKNLKTASQNIVVSNTLSEYRRCCYFLVWRW
jgi:hypothetical protein